MSPLQTQIVEMNLAQGLETKLDPFQLPLGKLLLLQNAVFTSPGKIQKRNGYAAMAQSILGGGTVINPVALFARMNELCQVADPAGDTLYSYDASNAAWATKGAMPSITTTTTSSAQPQFSTYAIDMAQATNGLQCFVYELVDTNSSLAPHGIGYTVVDPSTGQIVVASSTMESNTTSGSPHVVAAGNTFVCYYVQGVIASSAALLGRTLDATAPLAGWSGSAAVTTGTTTSAFSLSVFNFDVTAVGSIYIVFENRSGSTTVFKMTFAAPLVASLSTTVAATGLTQCVFLDQNGNIAVGISAVVTGAQFTVLDTTLSVVSALATLTGTLCGGTITGTSTAAGVLVFFTCQTNTNSDRISVANVGAGYVLGTVTTISRCLGISAKAFTISGRAYIPAWYAPNSGSLGLLRFQSPQNGIYVLDANGVAISKALIGTTGGYDTITLFSFGSAAGYTVGQTIVSGSAATFPASNTNILDAVVSASRFSTATPGVSPLLLNYNFGATAITATFADAINGYQRQVLANEVHTNGGVLQMYDGQNVVEHGFLLYPAFITLTLGGGGGLSAGTYQVCSTYEWMDGQGQVHRSTPSTPVSFTATAGQSAVYVTPTLRLSQKTGVVVQFYRTLVNQTEFFQISNFNNSGSLFNNPAGDIASFTDTQSDNAIAGNPPLYTTGGVLDNNPINPAGAMTVHRNRLFAVDSTNPTQIWYSKQVVPPAPVEFSGFQVLNIDPKGGGVTALASLEDKLIVFKSDRVFMVLGEGPDNTGNQNDFTDAIIVSTDTGCSVPKSVVIVPDGIMYQSPKGIYLLNRALQVSYIGAPVESFLAGNATISASLLRPNSNQIYFTPQGGQTVVVYDYLVGQWGTFFCNFGFGSFVDSLMSTAHGAGQHFILTSTGVKQETPGLFFDPLGVYEMTITTGWIKLNGLQGFQRARRVYVLGNYKSPHTLSTSIPVDYQSTSTSGAGFTVTTDPNPYQFMTHLAQQKCEAIQISVSELSDGTGTGESMSLSGLALEVSLKKGPYRLPATKTGG